MRDNAQPNLNIWNSAVPMHRAPLAFAPKKLVVHWHELQQVSVLKAFETSLSETAGNGLKFDEFLTAISAKPGELMTQRIQALDACKDEDLRLLQLK